jgi:DNA polymerase-3 subunit delta'
MILNSPYASYDDWTAFLESENKQLFISADEIDDQNQKFSLKSFEGGTKILIVWRADKMNIAASNKFLKFLEEPPAKPLFFLPQKVPMIFSYHSFQNTDCRSSQN